MDGKHKFLEKLITYIITTLQVTTAANVALLPFIIYHFQNIPLISILSNVLVSPLFAIVLILSFILVIFSTIFSIPSVIANLCNPLFAMFNSMTRFCADIPYGNIKTIVPPIYVFGIYYAMLYAIRWWNVHHLSYPRIAACFQKKAKGMFVISILFLLLIQIFQSTQKEFTITMIDVGQGDSTLIETRQGVTMLIDGGGEKEGSDFKIGERITVPYLLHRGIRTLDYVMISHFDSDHSAGVLSILENCKVKNVVISKQAEVSAQYTKFCEIVNKKKCHVIEVEQGDTWNIDEETSMQILFPGERFIQENALNNNSIVCKLQYQSFSMLFTGDIEKIAEEQLMQQYAHTNALQATVLKVAHHGSKGSSTKAFLEATKAKVAVIGVGKDNSFGHPHSEVLKKLKEQKMRFFRTDLQGEVTITIDRQGQMHVNTFIQ